MACLFTLILVIPISQNGQNVYFVKHHSHSNTFKMVNLATVNYHSTTVKIYFRYFFISQNIILISNLTILNVFIQIFTPITTHSNGQLIFQHIQNSQLILLIPNKNGQMAIMVINKQAICFWGILLNMLQGYSNFQKMLCLKVL